MLLDEPGSYEVNSGSLSWAAVRTAMGKPGSPLRAVLVGTLSPKATYQGHWYFDLVTAGSVPGVHVQALRGDVKKWDKAAEIRRVNPLMWLFPESRAILFDERDKGRVDSAARAEFQSYRLNQPTGDEATTLLPVSDWEDVIARDVPEPEGRCVLGIDLGGGRAWSAAVAVWKNGRIEARAMAPGIPSIAKQEKRDRVSAGVYQRLVDRGVLTVADGYRVPPVAAVWSMARQWHGEAAYCDRFRLAELQDVNTGRGRMPLVPRISRWSDSSADIRGLRRLAVDGPPALAVDPLSRDLLTASLAVSKVVCDDSGNVRLVKRGAHNECRDDVAAALVLAAGAVSRIPVKKRGRLHRQGLMGRRRIRHPAQVDRARWSRVRAFVFERDRYRCQSCGRAGRLECDHVRPVWKGGAEWETDNLQALCRGCHIRKTALEQRKRPPDPEVERWRVLAGL